jgi:hypothetical protein
LLKSKMAIFIEKRVLICFILVSIIDIVWIQQRWSVLIGLFSGGIISTMRFGSNTWIINRIVSVNTPQSKNPARSSMLFFLVNQIILLPVLFTAYFINLWFFTGIVAGILLVPFVIMINCVTEASGITHNNFE